MIKKILLIFCLLVLLLMMVASISYIFRAPAQKIEGSSNIEESLSIVMAPNVLASPDMWGVLLIEQIYKDESDVVTLKDSVFERRAMGAQYINSSTAFDPENKTGNKWIRRTQVYLIKPQRDSSPLQLDVNDFKNIQGKRFFPREWAMTIDDKSK